ncbi:MAG: electron transport complex subunit RsxC [Clostridia bacterium]
MKSKVFNFHKGAHPADKKSLTQDVSTQTLAKQSDYFIAMSQHIGASAKPIVEVGQQVSQGQLIGEKIGKVSANIFSSVSGVVKEIINKKNISGNIVTYIHIATDDTNDVVKLPPLTTFDKSSILTRIEEAGIVGLGGAGFPTAVKLNPNKPVDTLIINAAECEPYLNCDNRLLQENTQEVLQGIELIATALQVDNVIIGIESNKQVAYEMLKDCKYNVKQLRTIYPQGAEKVLIYSLTGRRVPNKGGLPMDVGVVVDNVATAYAVYDACINGNPLYKRIITVSGEGVTNPKNLWVSNGASHKDIFDFCGGLTEDAIRLISGGPLMGLPLEDLSGYTTKAESGLLALTKKQISLLEPTPCLNCGRCADACPMNLMPMYIDFYTLANDTANAVKFGALDCIECGCCSYVCPAKRWIVQSARLTKKRVREAKK